MALSPAKPAIDDPAQMAEYQAALEDKKANPHKWAATPSIVTQAVINKKQKQKAIAEATDATVTPTKRTRTTKTK